MRVSCCPADLTAYDVVQGACIAGDGHEPTSPAPTRVPVFCLALLSLTALLGVVALAGAIGVLGAIKSALGLDGRGTADHPVAKHGGRAPPPRLRRGSARGRQPRGTPLIGSLPAAEDCGPSLR